jgi:anthranilate synthase component 1
VIKGETLYVQAGGGVVYDSDPASEYQETVHKSGALMQAAREAHLFLGGRSGGN